MRAQCKVVLPHLLTVLLYVYFFDSPSRFGSISYFSSLIPFRDQLFSLKLIVCDRKIGPVLIDGSICRVNV